MVKTIRVIDLLNKIANGEEVPEKIKYDGTIWQYHEAGYDYKDTGATRLKFFSELIVFNKSWLTESVEIIEEQQDIDKIKTLNPEEVYFKDGTELVYKLMYDKINEIAMRVNKISKNIKDKE